MLSDAYYPKIIDADDEQETVKERTTPQLSIGVINCKGVIGSASYFDPSSSKILCTVVGPHLGATSSLGATGIESGTFECEVRSLS